MRSLSAERNACFVRILVTISPRLYRETLALAIYRHRPDFEVLLAPLWPLDGRAERFEPHVLVQDVAEAGLPLALAEGILCRVRLSIADRIDATIKVDGTNLEVHDVCIKDLLEVLGRAELLSREDSGG
jgi:hypothetical protein